MKKYGVLALMVVIVLLPVAVHAQDGNQVPLAGGYTISLPDGWEQAESEGVYTFSQGDLSITLTLPDVLVSELELNADMDAADVLVEAYSTLSDQTLDKETDVQTTNGPASVTSGNSSISKQTTAPSAGCRWCWRSRPASLPCWNSRLLPTRIETALPDAFATMMSLQGSEPAADVNVEPCLVRAATRLCRSARRAGRESRRFHRRWTWIRAYSVLGKKTLEDGSLWLRLDIADTGGANELWVADADVETTGACDQVADVDAPPIIPAGGGTSGGEVCSDCYYDAGSNMIVCEVYPCAP